MPIVGGDVHTRYQRVGRVAKPSTSVFPKFAIAGDASSDTTGNKNGPRAVPQGSAGRKRRALFSVCATGHGAGSPAAAGLRCLLAFARACQLGPVILCLWFGISSRRIQAGVVVWRQGGYEIEDAGINAGGTKAGRRAKGATETRGGSFGVTTGLRMTSREGTRQALSRRDAGATNARRKAGESSRAVTKRCRATALQKIEESAGCRRYKGQGRDEEQIPGSAVFSECAPQNRLLLQEIAHKMNWAVLPASGG